MEVCEDFEVLKKSFKYKEDLFGSLNLQYDASKAMFVFWNKYQIFLHEGLEMASPTKMLTPEFLIYQILVTNNYLICVDLSGNVHTISLKFKNPAHKRLKSCFQPREEGVLQCTMYTSDSALSLKMEYNCIFLCQHKINAEFQLEKKVALLCDENWLERKIVQGNCVLHVSKLSDLNTGWLKSLFPNYVEGTNEDSIVLISFDKLTIYACLFGRRTTDDAINLIKLYTSPSEICDFKLFDESSFIIGLACGTMIHLSFKEKHSSLEIIHLNTAIAKFIITEDILIYTDGLTMWRAENIFSKENIKFHEYFVKDVKDFILQAEQIICTTYSNFIYTLPTNKGILKDDENGYSSAEKIFNNLECLQKITEEIEANKEIINKIDWEGDHLTAVALSKRPDIMDKVIEERIVVYESYEEALKDSTDVVLTENLEEYFNPYSFLLLLHITTNRIQHSLSHVLIEMLKRVFVHITLIFEGNVLKMTSLKLNEPLKKLHILMPLHSRDITSLEAEIKLVLNVPGTLDKNQETWTVLHKNTMQLNIENFIKTNEVFNKVRCLKETSNNIEDLIMKTAEKQHGELFKFTDISKSDRHSNKSINFFVKLPDDYKEIFQSKEKYTNLELSPKTVEFLGNILAAPEFLNSKGSLTLIVGKKNVILDILSDDFSSPVLRVSSADRKAAFGMRNFFGNFFYKEYSPGEVFVNNALYTTAENIQKALKVSRTPEEYLALAEKFHRNVVASLPI